MSAQDATPVFGPPPPLEACAAEFWELPKELAELCDASECSPSAGHGKTLAELGPSPFPRGGFPLIGFLASVYDKVSRYAEALLIDANSRR